MNTFKQSAIEILKKAGMVLHDAEKFIENCLEKFLVKDGFLDKVK
ncbi:MAG: hypothetical protein V1860_01595 [bacterium]